MLPRPQADRPTTAPLPLSQREQQVCDYLSQDFSFETIARHLSCSPAAARAYHRRALASLEPCDRPASAKPEPAITEQSGDRPASALASICERKLRTKNAPFHSPAVDASALLERPSPLDLYLPSLFISDESAADLSGCFIDVTTCSYNLLELPQSLHPRRQRTSRCSRWAGVGDRMAS